MTPSASAAAAYEGPGFQYLIQHVGEAKPDPTPARVHKAEAVGHGVSDLREDRD